mgnify:CR=1 FL=1|jgi:hypothetical protein
MLELTIENAGPAHQSADVPGDLLVGPLGNALTGILLCCWGIVKPDGTIENWSNVWSSADRYHIMELP